MSRHLRAVPPWPDGPIYVVGRSAHVDPGAAYVVVQCVDDAVAAVLSLAGHESHRRDEMLAHADLADALARWEAGDHGLHGRERAARAAFGRPAGRAGRRLPHPSALGKLLP